ncbi:MAG TPA: undecaprenyl-phosphate glucose phosphotransferase [Polyangia bacterium]|nr:undecaprenyl-phosphate glucose phosphotransferase [Polyangia bacterium]
MLLQYQFTIGLIARLLDISVVAGIWLASFWLRFYVPIVAVTKGFPEFSVYAAVTPLIAFLWFLVFDAQQVYVPSARPGRHGDSWKVLKAHLTAIIVFVALSYVFTEYRFSRGVLVIFGVLTAVALIGGRLALRSAIAALRRGGFQGRRVLLIGEPDPLATVIARFTEIPELGVQVAGVLIPADTQAGPLVAGAPVLGDFSRVAEAIESSGARQVVIALPRRRWSELEAILAMIRDDTVDVQVVPDLHEYVTLGCEVETLDGVPIVRLNGSPLRGWGAVIKRVTDIALSAIALLILSPIFLIVAAAVKATSPGPIFYGQERMGLDGRRFRMFKFRSMRVDAESKSGAVWAQAGDDRRTPIGALLRATSLDELPQFWNVLVGDMSLVGPRPERPVFVSKFRHEIDHYMLRHKVKAGITGWAQVNGWRGNTSLDERIRCDLHYIKNWSYSFDLKILCLTVLKGFVNKNAY